MAQNPISLDGVFAVPPPARAPGKARAIDFEQNSRIVQYIAKGGISRFIYGGNAFLYHLTLDEYEQLLVWQAGIKEDGLWLKRVDRRKVISGIGERPAINHLRQWGLSGFTTGSGCLAPTLSAAIFSACRSSDYGEAERIRSRFLDLEDLRDAWGPARVLHHALEVASVAATGSIPPFVSELSPELRNGIEPVVHELLAQQQELVAGD